MKSVLISIQPKWCELIASLEKTVEVRKTKPKIDVPFKCYIYCTQNTPYNPVMPMKYEKEGGNIYTCGKRYAEFLTGKVIGEFVCKQLVYIGAHIDTYGEKHLENTVFIENRACLTDYELFQYLYKGEKRYNGGWAWFISDLVIYDQPKELREFWTIKCTNKKVGCSQCYIKPNCITPITRPPQSWCYVEEVWNG